MNPPPPPPPPPHGDNTGNRSGLPPGNYDIFIIPPHSAGSGFLYLPSLQPHRNSFLAGMVTALFGVAIWTIVVPVLQQWLATIMASGGAGVMFLIAGVGIVGWAWGRTQSETGAPGQGGAGGTSGTYPNGSAGGSAGTFPNSSAGNNSGTYPNGNATGGPTPSTPGGMPGPPPPSTPNYGARPPPKPTWQRANTGPTNTSGTAGAGTTKGVWEKAREETRKKEEDRRKAEEARKKRDDAEKETTKQREKDAREREARERREKDSKEKEARDKSSDKDASASPRKPTYSRPASPTKKHQQPTAHTATDDDAYSFRPYDKPKRPSHKTASASASSIYSESSYAPSASTARTTPPPSNRGAYATKDPDKIVLKAVYSFNNTFTKLPLAQLISGVGSVTDGLILRITTEGLFIDDDVRGVPQREWDVKAWTMKLVESGESKGLHVLRASIRDQEGKRYVFVLQEEEGWKVAVGLQRLRRGTQVRALGVSGMAVNETRGILESMGWA